MLSFLKLDTVFWQWILFPSKCKNKLGKKLKFPNNVVGNHIKKCDQIQVDLLRLVLAQ
jgi:hypothetical protein